MKLERLVGAGFSIGSSCLKKILERRKGGDRAGDAKRKEAIKRKGGENRISCLKEWSEISKMIAPYELRQKRGMT